MDSQWPSASWRCCTQTSFACKLTWDGSARTRRRFRGELSGASSSSFHIPSVLASAVDTPLALPSTQAPPTAGPGVVSAVHRAFLPQNLQEKGERRSGLTCGNMQDQPPLERLSQAVTQKITTEVRLPHHAPWSIKHERGLLRVPSGYRMEPRPRRVLDESSMFTRHRYGYLVNFVRPII